MRHISELGLIRIDDRLIHGQVIAVWCRNQKFTHIVIVDDGVAGDPFMRQVLSLAAPPGVQVDVLSLADAVKTFGLRAIQPIDGAVPSRDKAIGADCNMDNNLALADSSG